MVYNDYGDRAGLRGVCNEVNIHTHFHTNNLKSVHMDHTERVTRTEEREGENGIGGGIEAGGGIGHGNGVGGENGDVNVDRGGTGAGTRTKVKANEGTPNGSGDGCGNGAGTGTGTGVETCRGTQDAHGDGNEEGTREGGGEANKRKKPHETCRRDQSLSFSTRHHLCRPGVALVGTQQLRSQRPGSIHAL